MSREFVTTGRLERGKLSIRNEQQLKDFLRHAPKGEYLIHIERAHATRSLDQNSLYWAGYLAPLAEYTGYTVLELHAYFKHRFLPSQHTIIAGKDGVVLDERDVDACTTTRLNKVEFSEYLRQIETFAAELGVVVGSNRVAA